MSWWEIYLVLNAIIIVLYVWYRNILLFVSEVFEKKYPSWGKKFTVIIPVYNEEVENLRSCLISVYQSKGDKEIIIVDDGSTNKKTIDYLKKLNDRIKNSVLNKKIKILFLEKNLGKRHAHKKGFLESTNEIICVTDSDTVVDTKAFIELLKPFNDSRVGATTGNIKILNESENIVTKMQGVRYWTGLNIDRKSQSHFGIVTCCSGALAAYRKNLIEDYLEEYTSQSFLGEKCNSGDDRYLTNLILKNWRAKYVKEAIAYTVAPNTFKSWIKQLLRWKRSFIRESFICLKNSYGKKNLLFFETLLMLVLPILFLGIRLSFVISIIFFPLLLVLALPALAISSLSRDVHLLFEKPSKFKYVFLYLFVYNFVLYWLYFVALFTMKNSKWGTR